MSFALSSEGTTIYVPGTAVDDDVRSVLKVDLLGQPSEFIKMRKRFLYARYSPDGNYVAFSIQENNNDANIWIYHVEGEAIRPLTFYKSADTFQFAWSPDSKTIAFATAAEDSTNSIYIRNIDGTGSARKIYTSQLVAGMHLKSWSRNEDEISFTQRQESSGWDLFVYSFQDSSAIPYLATPGWETNPYFSPNGNWMLYQAAGPGGAEIYVRPYPESSRGLWQISEGGGGQPAWSPDGKRIYYVNDNAMYAVDVTTEPEFSKGNPRKLFEGNYVSGRSRRFDIHQDGESFIMISQPEAMAQERKIFVIQNFFEELKRLVPVEKN